MSETPWKKLLLAAGTAGAAAVLCYLLSAEPKKKTEKKGASSVVAKPGEVTKESVVQILKEICESGKVMKDCMKDLVKELRARKMSFEETYDKVAKVQPRDPLEKNNLSMEEFDKLLSTHHNDPGVRDGIQKVMGSPNASNMNSAKVQAMSVKKIIEVHQLMLKELKDFVEKFPGEKNRQFDMKIVTIVAQAIVAAKVEEKFDITSEEIETALHSQSPSLATNQEFQKLQGSIQEAMSKLVPA